MHIKEICLEGFKSYATRTVVPGFDPHFNAITGLNGSGKSNILDSVCFVLGITNLQQVRAANLQELVYKQGQAGITKATVSVTFDNSEVNRSPLGYEQHSEITVTRQIVVGGRNKYLINGKLAQPSQVQNLFHSTDKSKIKKVIEELDEKKKETLKVTWVKVNQDFGSIFSTLLPGTMAKLEPPEGGSFLDGLEVRVAFGSVWKQSLSELSGGQRSLLALSLILALLLFKPAPLYILDEVDAALDLSHTQNIGRMIKTHFPHSQFIVVSLKEGMFNNADVLFRTKFVDGVSTVQRTVTKQSK
ncbi:hypothetical protein F2Q68_00005545 [Brassica cretica]|uniref:RecF/RecN/SMC N-terminal domain-containing protein n=1 Tax=Brassica cretica TaxID=69181 RepID=A0A8S9J873_BRACR|nr:hypothetical protein F2Q68_00005545 [Brassica cretica]